VKKIRRNTAGGEHSRVAADSSLWRKILAIPGLPVLKNFLWKLSQNILPTKANLFQKRIVTDPLCPMCSTEVETCCHIIWRCPSAVAVWQDSSRKIQKLSIEAIEGWDFMKELWAKL
jgi:hypothetical protein